MCLWLTCTVHALSQKMPPAICNGLDGVIRGLAQDLNACKRIFETPLPSPTCCTSGLQVVRCLLP